jgi:hypothetical protein
VTAQPDSDANELEPPRVDAADKPGEQWLTAALEEYRSLRIEIIDAIEAQRKIMQLGVTALSVLIGLGLQRISPLLTVTLLTLLVPTVAIFVTAGALGELFRAARASSFLAYREPIINRAVSGSNPALEWEKWLRLDIRIARPSRVPCSIFAHGGRTEPRFLHPIYNTNAPRCPIRPSRHDAGDNLYRPVDNMWNIAFSLGSKSAASIFHDRHATLR